jgi:hypothetical protein
MDTPDPKFLKRIRRSFKEKMDALGADAGFVRYLVASSVVFPFRPLLDLALPTNTSQSRKLRQSNMKRMLRRIKREGRNDWKDRWESRKRELKDLRKMKYVQTVFGFEPIIKKPNRPKQEHKSRLVWVLKTYFERLTEAKTGRKRPCWDLIAIILRPLSPRVIYATDLASWWKKREKDFDILDADTYLESLLRFYQRNKPELDNQGAEWLKRCLEQRKKWEKDRQREQAREFWDR